MRERKRERQRRREKERERGPHKWDGQSCYIIKYLFRVCWVLHCFPHEEVVCYDCASVLYAYESDIKLAFSPATIDGKRKYREYPYAASSHIKIRPVVKTICWQNTIWFSCPVLAEWSELKDCLSKKPKIANIFAKTKYFLLCEFLHNQPMQMAVGGASLCRLKVVCHRGVFDLL